MHCSDVNECFKHISAYFNGSKTGLYLIVNTENYDIFQEILQRLQADSGKKCIYVSDNCISNGLPDTETVLSKSSLDGKFAVIGLSQALMLRGYTALDEEIDEILSHPISGQGVILLDHCKTILNKYIRRDVRINDRVILVDGNESLLPRIKLIKNSDEYIGNQHIISLKDLFSFFENISDEKINQTPEILVMTNFSQKIFSNSVYAVSEQIDIYDSLVSKFNDLAMLTIRKYGEEYQWKWLAAKMNSYKSFSEFVFNHFGSITNISLYVPDAMSSHEKNDQWLIWLLLKMYGEKNNKYLTLVLKNSENYNDFMSHIYLDIIEIDVCDADFDQYYIERKKLISQLPNDLSLIARYCEKIGIHQKNEIFYLTDNSEAEKYEFLRCLDIYEYTAAELDKAILNMSENLAIYMKKFIFDSNNTKLSEGDKYLLEEFTEYFNEYKLQKIRNHIFPEFLEVVNTYALSRPYNKLQTRSSIVSRLNKENTNLIFFDALGVEYLSFIIEKCKTYDLVSKIYIGRCELPSITEKNKEFMQFFTEKECFKIDKLDEIKHHSQVYNYQKCEYPLHIFEELDVIEKELQKIQSMFLRESVDRVVILSDHGASRLAVRYDHEREGLIELDESGEHSGRCCPCDNDPMLPFAAYYDGYSILANYDRFKGSRKANVEVHGGASLEEVLVPIIVLSKKQEDYEIKLVNSVINLKPHSIPELILYSAAPIKEPILHINGEIYNGEFVFDNKHIKFLLDKIKRKGNYCAELYDGNKNMSILLNFELKKQTREVDLF